MMGHVPESIRPQGHRARAWSGDDLVAESERVLRQEEPDQLPVLWFPETDVRLDHLDAAWTAGDGALRGFVALDPSVARVELVDAGPHDAPRDVTLKRFPTWGDVTDLVALLDVEPDGDGRFTSGVRSDGQRPVVEGSQLLAQAIVAAGRHSPGRRPVSVGMIFARAADARTPVVFELSTIQQGRTFTALDVHAVQGERICATGSLLLDETAPDVIRHATEAPAVPGPYDSTPVDMGVMGRDLRVVDDAYTGDPDAPTGPPVLDAWVRCRDVPPDPSIHAALLAQFTGHLSIAAAMRPHAGVGQDQAHRTLSTGINAIHLAFHADVRADRWLLYRHVSTFAGDGMTHAECRVHDEDGGLVASFTVEAMVRAFAEPSGAADPRTAL